MKYLIDKELREQYRTEGWVLISSIIPDKTCHDAYYSGKSQWERAPSLKEALLSCQDMARNIPFFQKWAISKDIGELAYELTSQKPLAFGFDQAVYEEKKEGFNEIFRSESNSLIEDIPLQGFSLAYFVFLKNPIEQLEEEVPLEMSPLKKAFNSAKAGDILFINPITAFSFEEALTSGRAFDFVALLSKNAVFNLKPEIFFSAPFKRKGVNFGDKLNSSEFKTIY